MKGGLEEGRATAKEAGASRPVSWEAWDGPEETRRMALLGCSRVSLATAARGRPGEGWKRTRAGTWLGPLRGTWEGPLLGGIMRGPHFRRSGKAQGRWLSDLGCQQQALTCQVPRLWPREAEAAGSLSTLTRQCQPLALTGVGGQGKSQDREADRQTGSRSL